MCIHMIYMYVKCIFRDIVTLPLVAITVSVLMLAIYLRAIAAFPRQAGTSTRQQARKCVSCLVW